MGYGSYLEFDLSTIAIIILAFIIYYYACYYQNREIYIFEEIKKYKISFKTIYVKNFIEKQGFKYLSGKNQINLTEFYCKVVVFLTHQKLII